MKDEAQAVAFRVPRRACAALAYPVPAAGMITAQHPQPLHTDSPAVVQELRELFDARLMELHATARLQRPVQENGTSPMVHVDFPAGPLQATAIYHSEEGRFTQIIARAADEAHYERPSFTISLFL